MKELKLLFGSTTVIPVQVSINREDGGRSRRRHRASGLLLRVRPFREEKICPLQGACQISHWNSGHKIKCKETRERKSMYALRERKVSLVPAGWNTKILTVEQDTFPV